MKKIIIQTLSILFFFSLTAPGSFADNTYFIDFAKVLNESKAGSKFQTNFKKKYKVKVLNLKRKKTT